MPTPINNLNVTISSNVKWTAGNQQAGSDYQPVSNTSAIMKSQTWGTNTPDNELGGADEFVSYIVTLAASASTTIDLSSLTNILQQAGIAFGNLKSYVVRLLSEVDDPVYGTNCTQATMGNAASNPQPLNLTSSTMTAFLKNGGIMTYFDTVALGFAAVTSTAYNLKFTNNDSVNAACIQLTLVGTFASANYFTLTAPAAIAVGDKFNFTVTAYLADGTAATGYAGTVHFSSSDSSATLPANSTLSSGVGTFSATFQTAGMQTLTGADSILTTVTGSAAISSVNDLFVANFGVNTVSALLGNGNGTFQAQTTYAVGNACQFVATADLNADGHKDLVTANFHTGSSSVSVLLGNGNGTFQAQTTYAITAGCNSVAIGDINGDTFPDLVTTNGSTVSVLLGNGNGTFQGQTTFSASVPIGACLADVNGDGKLDIVVANANTSGTVAVLLGNGNGTFGNQTTFATDVGPHGVTITDVNGDGKADLVTANEGSTTVSVLLGNGNGTFQAAANVTVGSAPYWVVPSKFW